MVKLFSKNSNLRDHDTSTLRADRRTDRQTTCCSNRRNRLSAMSTKISQIYEKKVEEEARPDVLRHWQHRFFSSSKLLALDTLGLVTPSDVSFVIRLVPLQETDGMWSTVAEQYCAKKGRTKSCPAERALHTRNSTKLFKPGRNCDALKNCSTIDMTRQCVKSRVAK